MDLRVTAQGRLLSLEAVSLQMKPEAKYSKHCTHPTVVRSLMFCHIHTPWLFGFRAHQFSQSDYFPKSKRQLGLTYVIMILQVLFADTRMAHYLLFIHCRWIGNNAHHKVQSCQTEHAVDMVSSCDPGLHSLTKNKEMLTVLTSKQNQHNSHTWGRQHVESKNSFAVYSSDKDFPLIQRLQEGL